MPFKKAPDLVGRKFGRLLVLRRNGSSKAKKALWLCVCDCGGTASVITHDLLSGHTQSCGCLNREAIKEKSLKHGKSGEKIFFVWFEIKQRCLNHQNKHYKNYGGRGIKLFDEWKNFQPFYDFVSKLPNFGENGYSLDRINNNGNYEPGNVRWATQREQSNNTRKNIWITHENETHTLAEWARIYKVDYLVMYRKYKKGQDIFKLERK